MNRHVGRDRVKGKTANFRGSGLACAKPVLTLERRAQNLIHAYPPLEGEVAALVG